MGKIRVQVKTSFGEVAIEGETAEEVLGVLRAIPSSFMSELETLISDNLLREVEARIRGIVRFTDDGPIIMTRARLTHYEAIGLILYASNGRVNTPSEIKRLLEKSGIKAQVSSRLNEMAKRGLVYKPDPTEAYWKLTTEGERWLEENLIPRLSRV